MKILGLIASSTDPASRARILQYKPYLNAHEIHLEAKAYHPLRNDPPAKWTYTLKKLTTINPWRQWQILKLITRLPILLSQKRFDVVWQNRLILPGSLFIEQKIRKPLVFDFDDAIWMIEGAGSVEKAICKAAKVFAGNEFLASYARKFNPNVIMIPSTVDTSILRPLAKKEMPFTLGWIGSPSNFVNLEIIKEPVLEFLRKYPDSKLSIVSSAVPDCFPFDNKRIVFKKWKAGDENQDINNFSVGLMPLLNNVWNLGKCSYKMIQYMSCGKPVIVSPVGNNNHILDKGVVGKGAISKKEWLDAFILLKEDHDFYTECSKNGRILAHNGYSASIWAMEIAKTFASLV